MLVVHLTRTRALHVAPNRSARRVGLVHATSRYLHAPMTVPVLARSTDGRFAKVRLPWDPCGRTGWISLAGQRVDHTNVRVVVHRSTHELDVYRGTHMVARLHAGTGAAATPTPRGHYFVTERVSVPGAQHASYGSYAFGLSGLQQHLPRGWHGNNQLAIHGTGDPTSIGRSASAGCVRVSETGLAQLRRLVAPGTPVDVRD